MAQRVVVHDSVYERAKELSENSDVTIKEAIRQMCREGGADV